MPAGVSAYTPLANITLGSVAASVTFSSISQAYRDLVVVCNATVSLGTVNLFTQFNSDGGSNYYFVVMRGNGAVAASEFVNTAVMYPGYGLNDLSTVPSIIKFDIMDYSATDKHKSVLFRSNHADYGTMATAGRWASTSAVNTIKLQPTGSVFAVGSTFALYGVSA
jgi:hypothetical protein